MIVQLNPTLPLITPLGPAYAHFLIDYGEDHHLMWVCIQDDGQIWTWPNTQVSAQTNPTFGRHAINTTHLRNRDDTAAKSDLDRQC